MSKGNVTRWKEGTVPSGDILVKLASYLNVSVSDLLEDENTDTPSPSKCSKNTNRNKLMFMIDQMDDDALARFLELAHLASLPKAEFDRAMAILRLALPNDQD